MIRGFLALVVAWLASACATHAPQPEPISGRFAIRGHIVTPEGVLRNGWLAVDGGVIASIGTSPPDRRSTAVLEIDDYVFPAFVDLHNHPMYAVFPRWTAPRRYGNRYEWRTAPDHMAAIATPQRELLRSGLFCDVDQFAEVQALIGGTGSITGVSRPAEEAPACIKGLVRNLDWPGAFSDCCASGKERVRTLIGVTSDIRDEDRARRLAEDLRAGAIDALIVHLAEGGRTDALSQAEFAQLEKRGFFSPRTVIVHGVALGEEDLAKVARAGASIVWSPRSNLELYGETLDIVAALRHGIRVALGPDWSPTGSLNMLEEIRYARAYSREALGNAIGARQLFEMATIVPARIAGVDRHVGSLVAGKRADFFLLRGSGHDPYEALAAARAVDVSLTVIDGVPVFADPPRLRALGVRNVEGLEVCGTTRGLNAASLVAGSFAESSARVAKRLRELGTSLGPLAECR